MILQILFFTLVILGIGILIFTKNVVYAAYALALVLISLAGCYVLLNAELLAVVQILLYAGGAVILLLFGVMMTNRLKGAKLLSESTNVIPALLVSLFFLTSLIYVFSEISFETIETSSDNQVQSIGILFLTEHIVVFELIAFILLVALVGAAYLAKTSTDE